VDAHKLETNYLALIFLITRFSKVSLSDNSNRFFVENVGNILRHFSFILRRVDSVEDLPVVASSSLIMQEQTKDS
jgi:hypothetical protein